ncbi:MAG: UvrD-helicase domain-containing protein, partial [Oscillospiraceae bacterium]|nr:UvrD-helicase domain-containing protein [Oscillospiraceae bacterium]
MATPAVDTALQKEQDLRATLMGERDNSTFLTNYLIEAGAGAGKSFTMTNRIVNLLLAEGDDGTPFCTPDQLVAITFTVKATQELQSKLEREFRGRLAKAEAAERQARERGACEETIAAAAASIAKLLALAEHIDEIQISTIDSFCRKLLTTMPFANPLGLSGVMESDETHLAKDFFARSRRRRASDFRAVEERYALRYATLQSAFLACCGRGDFRPYCPPANDPAMQKVEQELPDRALELVYGLRGTLKDNSILKDLVQPDLLRLLERQDADFAAGGEGLTELIRFYRGHSAVVGTAYGSVVSKEQWEQYYNAYSAFFTPMFKQKSAGGTDGLLSRVQGAPKTASISECQAALDGLTALIDRTPQAADWLDTALMRLVEDCRGVAFFAIDRNLECAELGAFRDYFAKHKTQKSVKRLELSKNTAEKLIGAHWKPKVKGADGKEREDPGAFGVLLAYLLHRDVMNLLAPSVEDYRNEKLQLTAATFNDVLVMARNMLRASEEARNYFRSRYRCFYVDEFQDTDAIQTELLFYLAGDGSADARLYASGDWENCKPRPGSLFLVGDPKQGIYRFRGADVSIYDRVKRCFREKQGFGEVHVLHFNFRSTREICDFSRRTFQPGRGDAAEEQAKETYPVLTGSAYQAPYEDMTAVGRDAGDRLVARREDPRSRVLAYESGNDPEAVACFVQAMIQNAVPLVPRKNDPAPTPSYRDFLILTPEKQDANAYADALRKRGIPVILTGEAVYSGTPPIAAAVHFLRYLLEPEDTLRLLNVLHRCYGAAYRDIRRLRERSGGRDLPALFRRVQTAGPDGAPVTRPETVLESLTAALRQEQPRDEALLALCAALLELRRLRRAAIEKPAMAVIELLFGSVGALWPKTGTSAQRRVDYARVQQFLGVLRNERERDFAALAARALELAEETVESEMPLEPVGDCVCVMNLHKAKGLEGEIVILAAGKKKDFTVTEYRETAGRDRTLHLCVTERTSGAFGRTQVIGRELNWDVCEAEESAYTAAERSRLLYVAATRAKSVLLINDNRYLRGIGYWAPIAKAARDLEAEEDNAKRQTWLTAAAAAQTAGDPVPAPPELTLPSESELRFLAALKSLKDGEVTDWQAYRQSEIDRIRNAKAPSTADTAASDPAADAPGDLPAADTSADEPDAPGPYTPVNFAARTAARQGRADALAESTSCAVTPSRLDRHGRRTAMALLKKDQENDEDKADDATVPDRLPDLDAGGDGKAAAPLFPDPDGESDETVLT